eukprot:g12.t1
MSTENVEDEETKQDSGVNPLLQKYEEYSEAVSSNPDDFQTWTYLLGTVERLDDMEKIIEVFDKFLAEYPLCYGYWKKYADATERHNGLHAAMSIYERGIQSVSYSVDLWSHYLTFQINKIGQMPDVIRSLFERGVAYIGHDYLSHLFWDKYFQFESEQREFRNLGSLYKRVISLPIKELESYYGNLTVGDLVCNRLLLSVKVTLLLTLVMDPSLLLFPSYYSHSNLTQITLCATGVLFFRFVDFAAEHEISEVVSEEEIESYLTQMMRAKSDPTGHTSGADADVEMEEQTNAPVEKTDTNLRSMDSFTDAEIKDYWIQCMAELYEKTGKELTIRRQYEDCIKRPYFHAKPLDGVQLQTWWKYLDYILTQEDTGQSIILFERCLVACALYPDFWIRYTLFLESLSLEQAQYALGRAVQVFCKKKSEVHLFAARFYERHGNVESARQSLELVTGTLAPTLLTGIVQQAAFEFRHGDTEKICTLYENKIETELETEGSEIVGYLAVQFAYTLFKRLQQKDKARSILNKVIEKRPDLLVLWEGSIQMEELIADEESNDRIQSIYKDSMGEKGKALSEEDQATLSHRLLHFLDLFGTPELYKEAQSHHVEHFGSRKLLGLHNKRLNPFGVDSGGFSKQPHLTSSSSGAANMYVNQDAYTSQAPNTTSTTSAMNPQSSATAQQYAQYYSQFAAAAAAAGYGNYSGYGTYTG